MTLVYGADRLTRDVDAKFWPKADVLDAATEVADRHGLDKQWLNNAAEAWMPEKAPAEPRQVVADYPALVVTAPDARYLFAMKVRASRNSKDIHDAALLYRAAELTSTSEAEQVFREYYPHEELTENRRRVLSVLGSAPGVAGGTTTPRDLKNPDTGPLTGHLRQPGGPVTGPDGNYGGRSPDPDHQH